DRHWRSGRSTELHHGGTEGTEPIHDEAGVLTSCLRGSITYACRTRLLRQMHADAEPALWGLFEGDVAAMAQGHVARDAEADTDAATLRGAGGVEPEERPEHIVAPVRG